MIADGSEKIGVSRVLRGGAYWNEARNLRSANRNRNEPENRNDNVGVRCVRGPRRQHAASLFWIACRARKGRFAARYPAPACSGRPWVERPGGLSFAEKICRSEPARE